MRLDEVDLGELEYDEKGHSWWFEEIGEHGESIVSDYSHDDMLAYAMSLEISKIGFLKLCKLSLTIISAMKRSNDNLWAEEGLRAWDKHSQIEKQSNVLMAKLTAILDD